MRRWIVWVFYLKRRKSSTELDWERLWTAENNAALVSGFKMIDMIWYGIAITEKAHAVAGSKC